jgi:hypothetical protein
MKSLIYRLIFCFLVIWITGCKKETTVEPASDHFSTWFEILPAGLPVPLKTYYNNSPQNVTIDADSIVIKRAGLYRFEGNLYVIATRSNPAYPVHYEMWMEVKQPLQQYKLSWGATTIGTSRYDVGGSDFSIDVYLAANSTIKLRKFFQNALPGEDNSLINGNFGGYRQGK